MRLSPWWIQVDLPAGNIPGARGGDLAVVSPVMPLLFESFTIPMPVLGRGSWGQACGEDCASRKQNGLS